MHRLLPLLCVLFVGLLAAPAQAQMALPCSGAPTLCYYETQPLTRPVPTAAPVLGGISGLSLSALTGTTVTLCPEAGQTLSGTGFLRVYRWIPGVPTWAYNYELDILVTQASTLSNPCLTWPNYLTGMKHRGSYFMAVADGVGVSGGTTVVVRLDGDVEP